MAGQEVLMEFLEKIEHDPGIDTGHIALFTTSFKRWMNNGCNNSIQLFS